MFHKMHPQYSHGAEHARDALVTRRTVGFSSVTNAKPYPIIVFDCTVTIS